MGALIAARRIDMLSFNSIAGNLDPEILNAYHHVSPLYDSLNFTDIAKDIAYLPQRHWVGGRDQFVPYQIAENWRRKSGSPEGLKIISYKSSKHMHSLF